MSFSINNNLGYIQQGESMIKGFLNNVNSHFQEKEMLRAYKPDQNNLKLDRINGFVKNLLRLSNKTMIGINRIHISRWKMFAGLFGLFLGYTCSVTEDFVLNLKKNYRPAIKQALILHVLRSEEIKDTLNKNLLENVYKNKDIQYSLHEVLDWKAIRPQQSNLFQLSKEAIIKALNDSEVRSKCVGIISDQVKSSEELIGKATLDFLESDLLIRIVIEQIAAFFRSETFYNLLSKQFIENTNNGLMHADNRDHLYDFCRDNFLSW